MKMALRGSRVKTPRANGATETREPLPANAPALRTVSPSTSIDASTVFEGSLRCQQMLRIDGCVEGDVECDKSVLVGEGARVRATITADEVQVAGCVEGDVTARRKITLMRTAVVTGDLATPGIVVEEGARLQGRIVIGADAEPERPARPAKVAARAEGAVPASAGRNGGETLQSATGA